MANTIGTPDSLGSMHLKGAFLVDTDEGIYYSIPLDLVVKKNEKENQLYTLDVCSKNSNLISNGSLANLLRWNEDDDEVELEINGAT